MTERKRAIGFALMDTAFAADAKFVRLARRASDPVSFAASVGVFWLILADARRARSASVNWEDYTEYAEQIRSLQDARLLTSDGFAEDTFDRWAPAYRSPYDTKRSGSTQDNTAVPESTQTTPTSTHISSTLLSNGEGGVGEEDADAFELAVRFIGYVPNDSDWRVDLTALEAKHGHAEVLAALTQVYATALNDGHRLKPWDLYRDAKTILTLGQHRAERELSNDERVLRAEVDRALDAQRLKDIERQHDEEFRRRHPDWNPGSAA